jgi:hypothetical protein
MDTPLNITVTVTIPTSTEVPKVAFGERRDNLDLLCGISHGGGPRALLHLSQILSVSSTIAAEIRY